MTNYFSDIKGKVVIVTGGSKGIGKEIAVEYSKLGARVIIIGRNIDDLTKVKKELDEHSEENLAVQLDINDVAALKIKIEEIYEKYKSIDISK
nr:SDR family NAD(P)-dependent oxidoreductase [Jeotgalicoccus sp. WY2]